MKMNYFNFYFFINFSENKKNLGCYLNISIQFTYS